MSQSNIAVDPDEASNAELTTKERHRVLSNERRKTAVRALADEPEAATLADLASAVAAAETDADQTDAAADEDTNSDAVTIELHHVHLPLLDEVGVVDYDAATKRVERAVPASALQST